ncbi:alpha/beta hydrolase [Limnohabitans sp. T6-5]|uniref:alpha/beta fold hydrolase n=1 Tax=Limnohabitans sp. T6-5 TaxID=1100724 RepID=UPI000D395CC5|nr:alpha/beta hydrolase [Limnohabitans sp. T6-5]PUE07252.1 alpha/beta hydrolase [Limnohabitans sp. T6-5]
MQIKNTEKITVLEMDLEFQRMTAPNSTHLPTLVFLHEGLGSVALWRDWPQQMCARLGCPGLVYSRQGYGQSSATPDVRGTSRRVNGQRHGRLQPDYMHHEALEVLPALLQALNIQRPLLLGHSDGGTIALIHASQHPVAGCIVMAPHVMVEDISVQAITTAREAYENGPLRPRLTPFHADVDCAFWQWNDVWLSDAFRSFDIRPELQGISAPLLAIQGETDPYGTMAQIDDIARAVPHAQLLKLPDCGHSPHRDQPEAVAQAVQAFVESQATDLKVKGIH